MSEVPPSKDMAEQAHHHTAEDKEGETQSTNMDHVSECKQEEADIALNEKQQLSEDLASSSASTNNDNGEDLEQPDVKTEERMVQGGSSPLDEDTTSLQADEESHGDYNRETPRNEQPIMTAEEISRERHTGEKKTSEATTTPTLGGRKDDQGDGPRSRPNEETPDANSTDTEAGEEIGEKKAPETTTPPTLGDRKDDQVDGPHEETPDIDNTDTEDGDGSGPETALAPEEDTENTTSQQTEEETHKQRQHIETIGPTPQDDAPVPAVDGHVGGLRIYVIASVLLVAVGILVQQLLQPEPPPQRDDVRQIDIFLKQLEKVKTQFPNQRVELWNRSKIHLLRHLQTAQPTEPVSLILTAGHRAERTLHCLAQSLASAFSSALNASVLHIDGAGKASQDSDQVKLDIDSKLQGAFEGDKPVAVINRFEELPPGSTLIFYRYCDHENAAYKKTCLIFTVLLGEEEEIPAETRLSMVEEMVDDHLQKKFISDGHPVSFDRMDLDKYGGLWSRISHLILPVAAEGRIEHDGC